MTEPTIPARFSFWKRFSLRTLFVLMTACCVLLGLWVLYVAPYRDQARSIAVVERLKAEMRTQPAQGAGWQRWLVTTLLGPDAFVDVTTVDLSQHRFDENDLRALGGLRHLESLYLNNSIFNDQMLAALPSFPRLRELSLRYTQLTDESAARLAEMPSLKSLTLTGTKVSDASVAHLAKLAALNALYIRWTDITAAGADQLRQSLPNCEIYDYAPTPTEPPHEPDALAR